MSKSIKDTVIAGAVGVSVFIGVILGYQEFKVYSSAQSGIARLKESESSKQILVQQALAEKEAASLKADAIRIMGQAAKEFPEYRNQEFIAAFGDALKDGKISQIIYVPTEANIPILEAGKRTQQD